MIVTKSWVKISFYELETMAFNSFRSIDSEHQLRNRHKIESIFSHRPNLTVMSFVHECNKNNRHDTIRDKFAGHSKIWINRLWFICWYKRNNQSVGKCLELKKLSESIKPRTTEKWITASPQFTMVNCGK